MAQGYILTTKDIFDVAAQARDFAEIKAELAGMAGVRLDSAQDFIGTMVIKVDDHGALETLQKKYGPRFHFKPERQIWVKE